ncbi:hypothetical protein HZA56_02315 [Candidatus Poribacteria bacterium]|nr:hypothetical protein [Candidatus Poribacteria bacterium]
MRRWNADRRSGFTVIEIAIAMGIMGMLTLVIATIFLRTVDSYGQMSTETDAIKQARYCLDMISREMRESVNASMSDATAGPPLGGVVDAILLTSARQSDGTFAVDANNFPVPRSIVFFYLNVTPEGITQLVRHQLYYAEDLHTDDVPLPLHTPPFVLANPTYFGANIVMRDNGGLGAPFVVNRSTGAVNGTAPTKAPKILMNRATSFDLIDDGTNPLEARITCQYVDRYGRPATSRLNTRIQPRNL